MWLVIGGMGYLCDFLGITTAIAAHFAIDVVLLYALVSIPLTQEKITPGIEREESQEADS